MLKGIFSKKEVATPAKVADSSKTTVLDNNQIEAFLEAYMANNNINPKHVMIQDIKSSHSELGFLVKVKAVFPGMLLGKGGKRSGQIAGGLSKMFNCKLRLEITD